MKSHEKQKLKTNGGQALLMGIVLFLFLSLSFITGVSSPILRQSSVTNDFLASRKSYFLSESGVEDVIYKIKNNKQTYTSEDLTLDGITVTTTITETLGTKTISTSANSNSLIRKVEAILKTGTGSSFSYGIQSGAGGFVLGNNAIIHGSLYANGSTTGSNGAAVTGTAISTSLIDGLIIGSGGVGNAEAYQVKNSTIAGSLYCQIGSGNNKNCDTSKPVPIALDFPITDNEIDVWKSQAAAGGIINGDYIATTSVAIGPKKIVGNLSIDNGETLTMTGNIWVTGNISFSNNVTVRLDSSYGSNSGILIADGRVNVSNNSSFGGSGQAGSYIMTLTTSDCPTSSSCAGAYAMDIANNAGAVILNAQKGTIHMSNGSAAKQLTAYKVFFDNNSSIDYEQGVTNTSFVNGPTGGWNISSWAETE
ncbi:MAG: hypothetical protein Q7S19_00580 [bacterium]|nr:hypothetical protein [bacterium]